MKKRVLSLFLAITLCLTLTPTGALAAEGQPPEQMVTATQEAETDAGENASPANPEENPTEDAPAAAEKNTADEETGKEAGQNEPTMEGKNELPALNNAGQDAAGGGIYVAPGSPTEGGGGTYISGEDTRTEIRCTMKPSLIQRSYDGTTDGGKISIDLGFTDGTNTFELTEGTGFTAKKTFDSADAGQHTVTVEIELIGEAAAKYKLKAGEETFTIDGYIDKAYPDLTVSLSKAACTVGEKILPLLSTSGVQENAAVTYYYAPINSGYLEFEGSEAVPAIDENTAISEPGTYYVYAKTAETTNYEEDRSATVALTVTEPAAASVTKADGSDGGTYKTLPAALDAAQDGDTVKLLADHTTNWDNVDAGDEQMAVVRKTLTLDLNGMTVDYLTVGDVVPDEEGGILESYDGNLTVVDNIQGGSCGKIKNLEFVKGSLAIQGGRIGDDDGSSLTCNGNSGTVTISGGTVCNATVGDGAAVTVTGGTGHAGGWYNDGTLNITDGTFGNVKFRNNGGTIAISGGTFGTITNSDASSTIPLMPLLADNYVFYQGDNAQNSTEKTLTNVTVRPHTHSFENGKCDCGVAAIVVDNNNSCYNTLQAALDAAADDASVTSVTLGQDLTEDIMFSGSAAGSLTLNMNGHKLEAEAGVPLTVTGGTLRIEGAAEINQNTASNATAFPAISLTGGKLVITGDLTAQGGYDSSSGRKPAIYATDGELDLQGNVSLNGGLTILDNARLTNLLTKGTFYAQDPNGNATADNVLAVFVQQEVASSDNYNTVLKLIADGYAIYKKDGTVKNAATFTLNSDTYSIKSHTCNYTQDETHGIAYCKCGRSHAHRDLSEEKSVLVNGICPICGYHCPHKNIGDDGVCKDCNAKMVAKVTVGETTTFTADLADALNKAANDTTIKLLANAMLPDGIYVSKTLTLDLNGHSLSGYSLNVGGLTPTGQVRTGNLTVIDSSGGNGAVGVTVRNGGTLVFDPENDHTTLLQLEVWGGTVELYGGKISRSGLRLNNGITLGNLLPGQARLAYYRDDTQLTPEEAASQTCDLVVKSCSHGGKNGFDESATACPYCGAPAVAETTLYNDDGSRLQRRFADLQTALDADRDGGATLYLLTDVTGDYTIDGTKVTGLDLNGHSIKGTVTVKGIKGDYITTTLSNTENTTPASIDKVVAYDGAELAGSGFPAVIGTLTLAEGATWNNILNGTALGYKVLNTDGTYKWYAPNDVNGSQLNNVIINRLPITTKNLSLKVNGTNVKKVERGTTVQLCAGCNANGATVEFSVLKKGETTPITLTKPSYAGGKYTKDYSFDTIGEYTIYFTATKDGYSVTSSPKTLTVTKPNLSNAKITFRNNSNESTYEPYNATTTAPGFTVTYNGKTLKLGVDYTASGTASPAGVSTQRLTIKAVEGSDYTGSKTAEWRIVPHKAKVEVGDVIKAYDGTTDLPDGKISLVSAAGHQAGRPLPLSEGSGFELTDAKYDSANASETEKNISFTVKLTDTNYTFEDGTTEKAFTLKGSETDKTFKIDKATIASDPQLYQTVFNDLEKTYKIDLKQFLDTILPEGGTYGDIQYGTPSVSMYSDYYPVGGATIEDGKLSLSINKAASIKQGKEIGTVTVEVKTTNYQPFTLTIHVSAQDKLVPVPAEGNTVSATEITYGQTLADSKLTVNGTMQDRNTREEVKGTFAWTDDTIKPAANDSYEAEWTFTPAADYEKYAAVTGTVTIKVKPAKLTVSVKASSMYYTGEEQIASIIASGQSVDSTPVTFTYSTTENGIYTSKVPAFTDAGTYTVYYKAEAANHEPATGTFTVTIKPMELLRFVSTLSVTKTYDGTAVAPLSEDAVTFNSRNASNLSLPTGAYSITNARFTMNQTDGSYADSPEVGNGKSLSFTVTLTSDNYVFESTTEDSKTIVCDIATDDANRFTITKAAAPTDIQTGTLNVVNGTKQTYTYDFSKLLPKPSKGEYGTVSYGNQPAISLVSQSGYYYDETIVEFKNGQLILAQFYAEDGTMTGQIGTVKVKVTTTNYDSFQLTLVLNAVNQINPVPNGTISASEITYGDTLSTSAITGKMKDPNTGNAVNGTFAWTNKDFKPDASDRYEAEWTFTPDAPEYATATGTVTIKVNKATPTFTAPTAQENLTYTGREQALIIACSVTSGGTMQYSLTENGKYSQDIPTGTDAGAYTVWYRVIGDANHKDTAPASVAVRIGKKPLTITGVTAASKLYDGTKNAGITSVTFDNVTLKRDTDYTVTASFDDAGVGSGKNVTATVTLIGPAAKNYALEQSSFTTTGSITKAAAPGSGLHPAVTVINDLAKTYEMVLSNDYLPKLSSPCEYGNVSYSLRGTYLTDGYKDTVQVKVMEENGQYKLKLTVPAVDYNKVSSVGTIDVRVTSDNYRDFYLTIGVKTKNKDVPVPDGPISASDITYGQALNDSKIAGKMKAGGKAIDGTFTWTNGTFKPAAGDYPASWTFTPAKGYEEYATATGTATVTVDPKAVTVRITPNGGSYGETITPATATANDVVGEDNPEITLTYTGTANDGTKYTGTTPPTKAGTYTIKASTTNANYTLVANTATATFTVAKRGATVTPDNKSKVYQEKDPDLTYKVDGVLDGETLKGITLTRAEGENAGQYAITATADAGANPNYKVMFAEGTLTIEPKSIKGATVVLGKGLIANGAEQTQTVEKVLLNDKELPADSYTVAGNTATDPGSHTLTITAKGNYTGTVEQTYVIITAKAEDAPGEEIAIGSGKVKVNVKFEGTVPPATLLTNKAELLAMLVDSGDITADELAQIADGASVDIALTVKEANVSDEVKTAMAQAAKGYTIGQYLDISLFKYMTVNGNQQAGVALHTTKDALTISVVVPDALIHTDSAVNRTYCIVRRHDGAITVLDAAFDAASKTLTFKTDRFSDYAIAYKDTAVPSSGSNPGSNNSSNGSETKKNEVAAPTPAPTPASTSKPSTITAMPQTGDTSNPTLYVVLLVASLLGLAVVFVCKKRNDK